MSARIIGPVNVGRGRSAVFIELTGRLDRKSLELIRVEIEKVAKSCKLKVKRLAVTSAKGTKRRKKK